MHIQGSEIRRIVIAKRRVMRRMALLAATLIRIVSLPAVAHPKKDTNTRVY
jgi:hypothetical protein